MTTYINGVAAAVGGYTEGARVYHSANQEIASGGSIVLAFDSERWDTDNIHDPITNNSRLTCRTAGKYLLTGCVHWETKPGDALGDYYIIGMIILNGVINPFGRVHKPSGDGFHADYTIITIMDLGVGDYAEMTAYQNSGVALDAEKYGECSVEFEMERIG